MKKIFTLLFWSVAWAYPVQGQTILAQGDMSIIGINNGGAGGEQTFAFVTWVDLDATTVIRFTDNGFNGDGTIRWAEQLVTWTATGAVTAGTVITIKANPIGSLSASTGTVTSVSSTSGGNVAMALSSNGDQLFAFQGNPPATGAGNNATFTGTLLYGIGFQGLTGPAGWVTSGSIDSQTSYLPSGLTQQKFFVNNVAAANYTGARTGLTPLSSYKSLTENTTNYDTATGTSSLTLNAAAFEDPNPLTLINFSGSYKNGLAALQWLTADEVAFSHFEVEKSTDAVVFRQAGSVAAKGNGLYGYTTEQPESTAYYRLKMVDIDGSYEHSRIIAVLQESRGQVLAAYPNPATDHILIESPAGGILGIYDATGRKHLESTVAPGKNTVDIRTLPGGGGIYYGVLHGAFVRFVKE